MKSAKEIREHVDVLRDNLNMAYAELQEASLRFEAGLTALNEAEEVERSANANKNTGIKGLLGSFKSIAEIVHKVKALAEPQPENRISEYLN